MEPFVLGDGDLELSIPTAADIDRITDLCQDPDIQRWTTVPSPYARVDAERFVHDAVVAGWHRGVPTWAVRRRDDDGGTLLVGMIDLHGAEHGGAEVGYWLAPDARGAGVMHRAVGLVLDAGFDRLGLEVVQWRADVGNWASWRVVWRHGFRKEGTVRRLGLSRGRTVDQWIGTLLPGDPREPAAPWDGPGAAGGALSDSPGRDPWALVREFHEVFSVPVADDGPSVDRDRVALRMALIGEELAELVTAVYGARAGEIVESAVAEAVAADDGTRDVVGAADALGDLVYVIYGMANECGIPLPEVIAEIHRANLSKLDAGGRPLYREDGKVLKGAAYRPPDIAGILAAHGRDPR
ncbi:bifunctional GNAT family N-acetyltransferase/nucleoside triphosphate pyrophosphohydrolase family protein [Georgenia sp. MJ173]|uniref:bifunctional GNAT family N-acetyltransferase/nucleoside triphosphate pyrophosphohydrolase family protein n=1 Tax=Georgenia sunbinii TaxID=3117728 RepID=UPI002F26C7CC